MLGLESLSLDDLKKNMGKHSIETMDKIIKVSNGTNQMIDDVTDKIKTAIVEFLNRKGEISGEYKVGDGNGDAYFYENRRDYRNKIREVIKSVLEPMDATHLSPDLQPTVVELQEEMGKID